MRNFTGRRRHHGPRRRRRLQRARRVPDDRGGVAGDRRRSAARAPSSTAWATSGSSTRATQTVYKTRVGRAGTGAASWTSRGSRGPDGGHGHRGRHELPVTVTFDAQRPAAGSAPGRSWSFRPTRPTACPPIPVDLTVRFLDVPDDNQFEALHLRCGGSRHHDRRRPELSGRHPQLLPGQRGHPRRHGGLHLARGPRAQHAAPRVPEHLRRRHLQRLQLPSTSRASSTSGSRRAAATATTVPTRPTPALRCRSSSGRASMATTLPPACAGVFADVPCPGGFAVDFIEGLFDEGVTAGCGGGLLPGRQHHQRSDGGLPGEGVQHPGPRAVRRRLSFRSRARLHAAPVFDLRGLTPDRGSDPNHS